VRPPTAVNVGFGLGAVVNVGTTGATKVGEGGAVGDAEGVAVGVGVEVAGFAFVGVPVGVAVGARRGCCHWDAIVAVVVYARSTALWMSGGACFLNASS